MRVLIVDVSSKLGTVGGAQRVAANLFYDLKKHGIDTYYFGYRTQFFKENPNATFIGAGGGQKQAMKSMQGSGLGKMIESVPLRAAYYSFYSITGIDISDYADWLAKVNPDIVVANSIQDFVVLKKMKAYLGRAKFMYIDHANVAGDYKGSLDYNILALTFGTGPYVGLHGARNRHLSFYDGIIALNRTQERAIKRYNSSVVVIHSGPNLTADELKKGKSEKFRKSLGISKNNKVVLYVGRLAEAQKNLSTLIKAFRKIENKEYRLIFFGGGGKSGDLYRELAGDDKRINIVEKGASSMVPYYYQISGLYVLPSIWEGFNATLIEAASFGVPLLLSKKSINEDIVESFGKRLYTFEPHNVDELESKIRKCFEDRSLNKKLKELSRDIASEYSKKKQMDGYVAAFNKILENGRL
jgi:glycosyltransferase involved in cell wall biosynthesis